jgi:hypothetical protein
MTHKVIELLRTNVALALLCVISILMVLHLVRNRADVSHTEVPQPHVEQAMATSTGVGVSPLHNPSIDALKDSPFKDMPEPSHFHEFIYTLQDSIVSTSTCADGYRVVMVFPRAVDYRADPSSAMVNIATPCIQGKEYADTIDLTSLHIASGTPLYVIRASEGEHGNWHDPY